MHLLLLSGFLGSGKTSLITRLAKAYAQSSRRIAIIVNEIGDIGIDNELMRQLDLNVQELVSGCICCTLSSGLVSTLEAIDSQYAPDIVIIEASGVADPAHVLDVLPYYRGRPLSGMRTVSVVDPLRLSVLIEAITPLITSQIEHADLVVVTKTDLAAREQIDDAVSIVRKLNTSAEILRFSACDAPDPELISKLLP